ncbi:MAG: hypothetical protein QG604_192 [Candidatus Dependentiae bacterium]|nr:hypothetical protein [Candidatus Dependentiae bacterium]
MIMSIMKHFRTWIFLGGCSLVPVVCLSVTTADQFQSFLSEAEVPQILPDYWHQFVESYNVGLIGTESWYQVADAQIDNRFDIYKSMIAGIVLHRPSVPIVDEHPIVFWVVHGTWARESEDYWAPRSPVFQTILQFAMELARRAARPIEIVSYCWSGEDYHKDRSAAGSDLRMLAETFFSAGSGYGPHWALGHSHGVNVLLIASQETSFDSIISLGAPVLETLYAPLHVGCIYHFYSLNDPFQKMGAFDRRSARRLLTSTGNFTRAYSSKRLQRMAYNFRAMFDGIDPGHSSLKFLVPYVWDVIDIVQKNYQHHTHFNVNIPNLTTGVSRSPLVAIRDRLELLDWLDGEQELTLELIAQLKAELSFSKHQEDIFASEYHGRKLSDSSRWWQLIFANWIEFGSLLQEFVPALRPGAYLGSSLLKETGDT